MIAAGVVDAHERAVGEQELIQLLLHLRVRERTLRSRLIAAGACAATACGGCAGGRVQQRHHVGVFAAQRDGVEGDRHLLVRADEHHPALDRGLDAVEERGQVHRVRPRGQRDLHRLPARDAGRTRRPRQHFDDERVLDRRDEVRGHALVRPPGAAEVPRLETPVLQSPRRHLLHRPLASRLEIRRAGESGSVDIGEDVQRLENLRPAGRLLPDLPEHGLIRTLFCGEDGERRRAPARRRHRRVCAIFISDSCRRVLRIH